MSGICDSRWRGVGYHFALMAIFAGGSGSGVCLGAVGVGVSARLGMVLAYWAQASRGLRCPISFNIFIGKSPRCFG